MDEDTVILTDGRSRPFCTVCCADLPGDGAKAIKQHLKSKPHKQAQKRGPAPTICETVPESEASLQTASPDGEARDEERDEVYDEPCEMCSRLRKDNTYHTVAGLRAALERGEDDAQPCIPPPFHRSGKAVYGTTLPGAPFMTLESGWVPDIPEDLDECLDLYCNVGTNENNNPPNIDINGENTKPKSLSKARRMLQQADAAGDLYWAALAVDAIKHPAWWPRPANSNKCVGSGDVPHFNQVIVGNGPTDIGIHIDNAPPPCMGKHVTKDEKLDFVDTEDPQYEGVKLLGMDRVHVHTYITMARGKKYVIMMPPGKNFFPIKSPFPREVGPDLMERIVDAGGYYFALEPLDDTQHVTLFTPKGWHHWLLGATAWHVIFGASRF